MRWRKRHSLTVRLIAVDSGENQARMKKNNQCAIKLLPGSALLKILTVRTVFGGTVSLLDAQTPNGHDS